MYKMENRLPLILKKKKIFIVFLYIFAAGVVLYLNWPFNEQTLTVAPVKALTTEVPAIEAFGFRGVNLGMNIDEVKAVETGTLTKEIDFGNDHGGRLFYKFEALYGMQAEYIYVFNYTGLDVIDIVLKKLPPTVTVEEKLAEIKTDLLSIVKQVLKSL